jgi:hypothetical protein
MIKRGFSSFLFCVAFLWLEGGVRCGAQAHLLKLVKLKDFKIENEDFAGALKLLETQMGNYHISASLDFFPLQKVRIVEPTTPEELRGLALVPKGKWMNYEANGANGWDALCSIAAMGGYQVFPLDGEILLLPVPEDGQPSHKEFYRVSSDFPKGTALDFTGARKRTLNELFEHAGIVFGDGQSVVYHLKGSTLDVVHSGRSHILIRQLISPLPPLQQILISCELVRLPEKRIAESKSITDAEFEAMKKEWDEKSGGDLFPLPRMIARSGQLAQIEMVQEIPYPSKDAKEDSGYANYDLGLMVHVRPVFGKDGIEMSGTVHVNSLKDRDFSTFIKRLAEREDWKGHKEENLDPMEKAFSATVESGQTLMLPVVDSKEKGGQLLAFIRVEVIDVSE